MLAAADNLVQPTRSSPPAHTQSLPLLPFAIHLVLQFQPQSFEGDCL